MKKNIFPLVIFSVILLSCKKEKINHTQLLGSWKMQDVINNTGFDISEKSTYYKNDSFVSEVFLDDKLHEKFVMKYQLNKETNTLILIANNKLQKSFGIEKLNDSCLYLKDKVTNKVIRHIRY